MSELRRIRLRTEEDEYAEDIRRIQSILLHRDYDCSYALAKELWEKYSESMAAGWMCLGDDDDVFSAVEPYFVEDDDE